MNEETTFEDFGLNEGIMQALAEVSFKTPSLIQQEVIPHIMNGRDLIGQAQTGTGKTVAFGLPSLHLLHKNPGSQLLVMTPTRELAKQVSDELYRFSKHLGIKTAMICGGKAMKGQLEALKNGCQIVVATPGRLLDLLGSNHLPNFQPSIVVLDEADEMLDMGFLEDITSIFKYIPEKRQTLLFSATMPLPIKKLAERILENPLHVSVKNKEKVNQDIEQVYYMIREDERDFAVIRLVDFDQPEKAIIFCRTKKDVDRLTQTLLDNGYSARGLHGDMEQPQREEVIRNFRSDHVHLLIATDVAARGLSVSNVSHVYNYHLPFDANNYVHRIGRTGRAGNKGIASTLLTSRDWRDFQRFEQVLGTKIHQREIPNSNQVKIAKKERLAQRILAQTINDESGQILQLMLECDSSILVSKLISMVLGQQTVIGPDKIGLGKSSKPSGEMRESDRSSNRGPRSRSGGKFYGSKPSSSGPKKPTFFKKKRT